MNKQTTTSIVAQNPSIFIAVIASACSVAAMCSGDPKASGVFALIALVDLLLVSDEVKLTKEITKKEWFFTFMGAIALVQFEPSVFSPFFLLNPAAVVFIFAKSLYTEAGQASEVIETK